MAAPKLNSQTLQSVIAPQSMPMSHTQSLSSVPTPHDPKTSSDSASPHVPDFLSADFSQPLIALDLAIWKMDLRSGELIVPSGCEELISRVFRMPFAQLLESRFAFANNAHPDDKDRLIATLTEGLEKPVSIRFRLLDEAAGDERWVRVQMAPCQSSNQVIWCSAQDQTRDARNQETQKKDFVRRLLSSLTGEDLSQPQRIELTNLEIEHAVQSKWQDSLAQSNIKWIGPDLAPTAPASNLKVSLQLVLMMLDCLIQNSLESIETLEPGSPKWIRFESFSDHDSVYFAVVDSGAGVALTNRDLIFEPFVSTKSKDHSGLGLTLARAIAEIHGGTLRLDHFSSQTRILIQLPKAI